MSSSSWCCKASLKMLTIVCESSSAEHLRNSAGISSCPLARPVLSLPIASVTSSGNYVYNVYFFQEVITLVSRCRP